MPIDVRVQAQVEEAVRNLNKVDGAIGGMSDTGQRAGLSLTDLKSGLDLAVGGFNTAKAAVESVINPFVDYANAVEDVGRNAGLTAEQSSLLIQVTDDLRISTDTLKTATRELNRDGIQPSFENMRALAGEYKAIKSPVERAQFATAHFGRSAQEMTKFLEASTEQLDELAKAAEHSGLVLDEEGVKKAKAYQETMDDVEDSVLAVKVALAQELLPVIVKVGDVMSDARTVQQRYNDALEAGALSHEAIREIRIADLFGLREYGLEVLEAAEHQHKMLVATGELTEAERFLVREVGAATGAYDDMVDKAIASEDALEKSAEAADTAADRAGWLASQAQAAADAHDNMLKSHKTWLAEVADDVINALGEAGVNAQLMALGIQAVDNVFGTGKTEEAEAAARLKAINDEFARTGDPIAYEIALKGFAQGSMSEVAAQAEDAWNQVAQLNDQLGQIPTQKHVSITVETIYAASGGPGYTGSQGNDATGGGGSTVPDLDNDPSTLYRRTNGLGGAPVINVYAGGTTDPNMLASILGAKVKAAMRSRAYAQGR